MDAKEFNFIKKKLDALSIPKTKEERVRYYDSVTRGLCIRVTGNGKKSFTFYRKVQGRVVSEKLGDYPDMTIEQARGRAAELNGRIAKGERPWELSAAAKAEMTLEKLFNVYIERHAKKTRKTWAVMQKDFDRFAKTVRKRKLSEIDTALAEKLHGQIGQERGTYSANRAIQLLKAVYNKGTAWKLYDGDNPFAGVTLFDEKPREKFLTKQEAGRLLQAINEPTEDKNQKNLYDFIQLSLYLGTRKANLASMRWSDINFANSTLVIPDTKNGTAQTIALGINELQILKARRAAVNNEPHKFANTEFVFPSKSKTGHIIDIKRSWSTLRDKLKLGDCTIHDLRRSLGGALAANSTGIAIIKGILNHKDTKTTLAVYARTHRDTERDARIAVQAVWLEAAKAEADEAVDS